jgi:hypothetical protein
MYQKPEVVALGPAMSLIQGGKQIQPEVANLEQEKDAESLFED